MPLTGAYIRCLKQIRMQELCSLVLKSIRPAGSVAIMGCTHVITYIDGGAGLEGHGVY